jgi:hypothetical protein
MCTGKGTLTWMPDIGAWARDAARLLRPGGHAHRGKAMSAATAIEAVRHGQHAHGGDTTSAATAIERDTSTISTLTGAKL